MNYTDLPTLAHQFKAGTFNFPDEMIVSGIKYKFRSSSHYDMEDMIKNGYKGVMAYTTAKANIAKARDQHLNQWIMFLWGHLKGGMVPYDVRSMSMARGQLIIKEQETQQRNNEFIGSTVEVKITNLPGSDTMKGKVDTGADISSLHASDWKIQNNQVHFNCPELSRNTITVPLVQRQAVRSSDGGTEYRPVIELNVKINGKLLHNMQFNLNDRGKMSFPVLIGKNVLQQGKFKIDPSLDESEDINWNALMLSFKDDVVQHDIQHDANNILSELRNIIDNKLIRDEHAKKI